MNDRSGCARDRRRRAVVQDGPRSMGITVVPLPQTANFHFGYVHFLGSLRSTVSYPPGRIVDGGVIIPADGALGSCEKARAVVPATYRPLDMANIADEVIICPI